MPWTFPGVVYQKQLVYTQTVSFRADVVLLTYNPQPTAPAVLGDVVLTYGFDTCTIRNCWVDAGSLGITDNGWFTQLKLKDRREWWTRVPAISGEYNTIRVGQYIPARKKSLRELAAILMTALGESTADVSAVPNDVYPPVSWDCENVVTAAEALLEENGYSVALGFGTEAVTLVKLGTGGNLPVPYTYISTDSFTPRKVPRYVQNCFAESVAQVQLKLEAVGLETDGSWLPIDSLSYKPAAGWERTQPYSLPGVRPAASLTREQDLEAVGYVRRAYRVYAFADETLNIPDGSGAISDITDILPIQNRLLSTEDLREDESRRPFKIYGQYHMMENETGQPPIPGGADTAVGDRVTGREVRFDGENGLLIFDEPIWRTDGSDILPADLWLECTIQIRDPTVFSWKHYEKNVEVDPTGVGYVSLKHEQRAETIVSYNSDHVVTGSTTNQASLDAMAAAWAIAVAATYTATMSQHKVYCIPLLNLRCDGAVRQIQHIITCGDGTHLVNRTIGSANYEFDKGVPSRAQRMAHARALASSVGIQTGRVYRSRREAADD